MGNRAKPTKLKLLLGNPGHKAINKEEPEPESGIPKIPEWLKQFPAAVREWEYESKQLSVMGVFTMADPNEFAWRCYISSQMQELAADIQAEGRTIQTVLKLDDDDNPIYGTPKANPKCIQLAALLTEYRQTGSLYGLDPASRSKLKSGPDKKKSKIEQFMAKKNVKKK